jgi:hypothetical protein
MIVLTSDTLRNLLEYISAVQEEVREVLERTPASVGNALPAPIPGHVLAADQITEVLNKLSGINEFFVAAILDSMLV